MNQEFYKLTTTDYNWNEVVQIIMGDDDEMSEQTKFRRSRYVITPDLITDQEMEENFKEKFRKLEEWLNGKKIREGIDYEFKPYTSRNYDEREAKDETEVETEKKQEDFYESNDTIPSIDVKEEKEGKSGKKKSALDKVSKNISKIVDGISGYLHQPLSSSTDNVMRVSTMLGIQQSCCEMEDGDEMKD